MVQHKVASTMLDIKRLIFFLVIIFNLVVGGATSSDDQDKVHRQLLIPNALQTTPRIIGGTNTTPGRFPYYVALWLPKYELVNCGGSLIAPDVVLTASHCWEGSYFKYVAQVGRYNLEDSQEKYEAIEIAKYLPHPFYGIEAVFSDDFMLVFLNGSSSMTPVKINRDKRVPVADQNITVIGLGKNGSGYLQNILQGVTLSSIPNDECQRVTDGYTPYGDSITADSLCVWAYEKSYCNGDSGGPLFVQGDSPETDVQVGIVSWFQPPCYNPIFPNVAARVSEAADWIQSNVCRYSKNPPAYFKCKTTTFPPNPVINTNPVLPGKTFPITVEIDFDDNPFQTWWFILNSTQHPIYIVPRFTYGLNYTNKKATQVVHLPVGHTYTFVIKDIGSDGISYPGGYTVKLGTHNGTTLVYDGYFYGNEERTNFTIPRSVTPEPTQAPSLSKAPTISPAPTLPIRAVTLTIEFSDYSSQYFGYNFLNSAGEVVDRAPIGSFGYNNYTVEATIYLPKDEYYTFEFMSDTEDLYPGNYTLVLGPPDSGGPVLAASNGTLGYGYVNGSSFLYEDRVRFFLPNSFSAVPSLSPSATPSSVPTITAPPAGPLQTLTFTINFGYHEPSYFGYLLLNSRNRTVANGPYGTFFSLIPTAQREFQVPSEQAYTFILQNQNSDDLYGGNYSIVLGQPGDHGPELAPAENNTDGSFNSFGTVVDTATFYVPSTFTSVPTMAPTHSASVTLSIDFAGFPSEIANGFTDVFGKEIVNVGFGSFGFRDKTIQRVINLPNDQEYIFQISDYFGDNRFPGKFSLIIGTPGAGGETIVSKTGIQGFTEEYTFFLSTSPSAPVPTPTLSPKPILELSPAPSVTFGTDAPSSPPLPDTPSPTPAKRRPTSVPDTPQPTPKVIETTNTTLSPSLSGALKKGKAKGPTKAPRPNNKGSSKYANSTSVGKPKGGKEPV